MSAYELTLFVGNISFSATREELETLVRDAGYRVADTTIARREDGVTSKGFGFVKILTTEPETAVIESLYGLVLRDRGIRVERHNPKDKRAA